MASSRRYCTTTLVVRVVPWLLVTVAVGAAVGISVVLLLTVRRQRPVTGTVVVPRVCTPLVVVTRTVMVLPVVTEDVPLMSQLKRLLERAVTVAAVTAKVSWAGRGDTCTVTVPGVEVAPIASRAT
ncbi:hypothetical protein WR25_18298 [Diploscapter pachys]|uniref:Uncharacterized protein n=1 Tax=Diploscapter pachys TaxID=2018661 RepID=A0A2A2M5Y7_9BILA|nr:hypothetical protein WR25_18298 [Diploscapter pachys]